MEAPTTDKVRLCGGIAVEPKPERSRYTELSERRRALFDKHAKEYAEAIGKEMTGQPKSAYHVTTSRNWGWPNPRER